MFVDFIFLTFGFVIFMGFIILMGLLIKKNQRTFNNELKKQVSLLKQSQDQIEILQSELNQTFQDPVTHLPSLKLFEKQVEKNILESERYHFTLGLMCLEIEGFDLIQEALNPKDIEALLRKLAFRMQHSIRKVDSIARVSNDRFLICLVRLSKPETAAIVAARILQTFKEPFEINEQTMFVNVNIGVAFYPEDEQEQSALIHCANQALQIAKKNEKQNYQFYQAQYDHDTKREVIIYNDLNHEDGLNQLQIYYQPIVNVSNQSILCMDAESYWQHPQLGLIGPQELLSIVEKLHQLNRLFECLLKRAAKQFLDWNGIGFAPSYLGLSIYNHQLDQQLIYNISKILQDTHFDPKQLLLTVKSSSKQLAFDQLEKSFSMLRYMGINLALLGFGEEPFSLHYLKNLDIQYLKLTPGLIEDIQTNPRTIALITSLFQLAKNLSMNVIVLGVSEKAQIDLLKKIGCTFMQGNLLGAPIRDSDVSLQLNFITAQ